MRRDSASGIILVVAAAIALLMENSALKWLYDSLLNTTVEVRVGALHLAKPLLLWINDGLMTVFFLVVGLEVKREILEGELSSPEQIVLPGVGAIGGMLVPAGIYAWFNWGDSLAMSGWAIFDDLGAIVIIAIFYTSDLSLVSLIVAGVAVLALVVLNRFNVVRISAYVVLGMVLWVAVLKSGVHATLAGVVLGFAIPLRDRKNPDVSPLRHMEHGLHQWVAYLVVPVFAFANAGVSLSGLTLGTLLEPVPLGIAAGLFIGKQAGIVLFCGLVIWLGWARLPTGSSWAGLYGVSILCGIGFTMSLFITSLAFEQTGAGSAITADRLGILLGSGLSAFAGYFILRFFNPAVESPPGGS